MNKHKTLRKIIAYIIISPLVAIYVFAGAIICIYVIPGITWLMILTGLKEVLEWVLRYGPFIVFMLVYGLLLTWAAAELDKQKRARNKKREQE